MSVVALVPAKDRRDTVGATVLALRGLAIIDTVLVIDDGSSDDTTERARDAGAAVLRLERNLGKGGAVEAGIAAQPDAEIYVLVDADLGASAAAVERLVVAVRSGDADLAIGVLPPAAGRGGFGLVKRRSQQAIERACGFVAAEPLSGQRAVRGELLRCMTLAGRFGLEVGMTIDAVRAGAHVVELPVEIEHRHTGRRYAGFRHRALQGRDIVRALWPRLTSARQRIALIVAAGVIALAGLAYAGGRWQPETAPLGQRASKVVLFGFTHLSFDDLDSTPNLRRLMSRGAVGAMNVRTGLDRPDLTEAYATIGAGARLGEHAPSGPGALGDALARSRKAATVVGGASATTALTDGTGRVKQRPVGDDGATITAALATLPDSAVVLVDPGFMESAARGSADARTLSLRRTDSLLGAVADSLAPDVLLLVISPVPPTGEWRLTPFAAAGAGVPRGDAQSPSTKRVGLATITDLAPTVLAALGVPPDRDMVGAPLRYRVGDGGLARLRNLDQESLAREASYRSLGVKFVLPTLAVYGLALLALRRRRPGRELGAIRGLRLLVLASTAFPLATFGLRALPDRAEAATVPVVAGLCLLIAAVAGRATRHPLAALTWIMAATGAVVLADAATGSRLHSSGFLGYPVASAAGRFHGLTNTTFAVLGACLLLGMAAHVAFAPRRREAAISASVLAAVVIVGDGAPTIGDDVGGIITLVPIAGLALWCLSGRRLSWRVVAGVGALLALALVLAAGLDLARAPESRSHLGRFAADVRDDPTVLATTALRKAESNVEVLVELPWTWILPAVCGAVLYMLVRRRAARGLLPHGSALRIGVISALSAAIVGFLVNDSGPIVIAMFFLFTGAFLVLLALASTAPPTLLGPTPERLQQSPT